jgi:hypothetical protein
MILELLVLLKMIVCNVCFQFGVVHISKDDVYDDNNNVTRLVYQDPLTNAQHEWTFNVGRFKFVGENLPKSS